MNKDEHIETSKEGEVNKTGCQVNDSTTNNNNLENEYVSILNEEYDAFEIRAIVHRTANFNKKTIIESETERNEGKRTVSLPNLMSIKTLYECKNCGCLLDERHYYSYMKGNCGKSNGLINCSDETNNGTIRNEKIIPLYEVIDGDVLNKDEYRKSPVNMVQTLPDKQQTNINEQIDKQLFENETLPSLMNLNFYKYTSGLNKIPPLYRDNYKRRRKNCFNSLTKRGALPHLSRTGIYYRAVDYNSQIPDLMSVTITNPTLINKYMRNKNRNNRFSRYFRQRI